MEYQRHENTEIKISSVYTFSSVICPFITHRNNCKRSLHHHINSIPPPSKTQKKSKKYVCRHFFFKKEMSSYASSACSFDPYSVPYESLVARKNKYIDNLEFEKAKYIESIIQERRKNDGSVALEQAKRVFDEEISKHYEVYKESVEQVQREEEDAILQIREKADFYFQEMQSRHINELTEIEKEYALEVIKARNKIVPERIEQERRAKELARMNDFDGAVKLRNLALQIYEQEHATRRAEIDKKYDGLKKQKLERQRNDHLILNTKLKSELEKYHQEFQKEYRSKEKLLLVALIHAKQNVMLTLTKDERIKEIKKKVTDDFDKYANAKVQEVTGFSLNRGNASSSTPTPSQSRQATSRSSTTTPRKTPQKTKKEEPQPTIQNEEEEEFGTEAYYEEEAQEQYQNEEIHEQSYDDIPQAIPNEQPLNAIDQEPAYVEEEVNENTANTDNIEPLLNDNSSHNIQSETSGIDSLMNEIISNNDGSNDFGSTLNDEENSILKDVF